MNSNLLIHTLIICGLLAALFLGLQGSVYNRIKKVFLIFILFAIFVWLAGCGSGEPIGPMDEGQPLATFQPNNQDWVRGNPAAKITVVEYSDLECPYSRIFFSTLKKLIEEYPQDVKWVYRHFPLTSIHPESAKAAEASECAGYLGGQKKFWSFIDHMYQVTLSGNGLAPAELDKIAETIGLDQKIFRICLNSGKYSKKIQNDTKAAEAAGVQGTPYSVIFFADQKITVSGAVPYDNLKAIIDSILKK